MAANSTIIFPAVRWPIFLCRRHTANAVYRRPEEALPVRPQSHGLQGAAKLADGTHGDLPLVGGTGRGAAMAVERGPSFRLPRWFDTECKQQKRTLRQALLARAPTHAYPHAYRQLRKEYKQMLRNGKRNYGKERVAKITDLIQNRSPAVYKLLRKRHSRTTTPISPTTWRDHLQRQFCRPGPPPTHPCDHNRCRHRHSHRPHSTRPPPAPPYAPRIPRQRGAAHRSPRVPWRDPVFCVSVQGVWFRWCGVLHVACCRLHVACCCMLLKLRGRHAPDARPPIWRGGRYRGRPRSTRLVLAANGRTAGG
jgi:hypothetical protein